MQSITPIDVTRYKLVQRVDVNYEIPPSVFVPRSVGACALCHAADDGLNPAAPFSIHVAVAKMD